MLFACPGESHEVAVVAQTLFQADPAPYGCHLKSYFPFEFVGFVQLTLIVGLVLFVPVQEAIAVTTGAGGEQV